MLLETREQVNAWHSASGKKVARHPIILSSILHIQNEDCGKNGAVCGHGKNVLRNLFASAGAEVCLLFIHVHPDKYSMWLFAMCSGLQEFGTIFGLVVPSNETPRTGF